MSQSSITSALSEGGALHALSFFKQFLIYRLVPDTERPGKTNKYPLDAFNLEGVDAHNPAHWVTSAEALSAVALLGDTYGVAFVFSQADPYFFFDIDDCIDERGNHNPIALELQRRFYGAAVEVSQSGRGLHIFGYGVPTLAPALRRKKSSAGFDLYTELRFVALTGDMLSGNVNVNFQVQVDQCVDDYLKRDSLSNNEWTDEPVATWGGPADNQELIARMLRAKPSIASAFGGGATFAQIWNGDLDALAQAWPSDQGSRSTNPFDGSAVDASLARRLGFWTGWNCERIRELMYLSPYAEQAGRLAKWDARPAWLEDTIVGAMVLHGDCYTEAEPVRPVVWTAEPVDGFYDDKSAAEVVALLSKNPESDFRKAWEADAPLPASAIGSLAWAAGSNCETVLEAALLRPGVTDTPQLRDTIALECAKQTTWLGLDAAAVSKLANLDLEHTDFAGAEAVIIGHLPEMPNVFSRDSQLCWVDKRGLVVPYTVGRLSSKVETFINLTKGKKSRGVSLPEALAGRILGNRDYPDLGEIKAAVPYPTARADGSLITEPGLDEASGVYLLRGSEYVPATLDESGLKAALLRIWAPFKEFPFDGPVSAATMLAALLTGASRVCLETAPAFLIDAQAPGTGKSKLCECLMLAATESKTAINFPNDAAEQEKTLSAMLMRAPRGMYFDNLKGYLKDTSSFCMAMTSATYRARVLGSMNTVEISNRALWVLNGNNVTITGDAVRRVLTISMESPENPGESLHDFDPVEVIQADVEGYRRDILDVLHTYSAVMPSRAVSGYASFEPWNRLVRGCVLWLIEKGVTPRPMSDPLDSIRAAREDDPDTQKRELVMAGWKQMFGDREVFLADIPPAGAAEGCLWREAYAAICERSGRFDSSHLAYYLRTIRGRKTNGMMFTTGPKTMRGRPWRLVEI